MEFYKGGSCESDESYLTIKMDSLTQQYTIGTPVDLTKISQLSLSNSPKRPVYRIHSLSAIGTLDDKGNSYFYIR